MHLRSAVLALLAVCAVTAQAAAFPATATTAVNVRSGPGTDFEVLGTLQRNQLVEVLGCEGGWCQVEDPDFSGWASQRYLAPIANTPETVEPEAEPLPAPGNSITIETPDFTLTVGSGSRPGYRPADEVLVCFFDGPDTSGESFCAGSGDRDLYLAAPWNDAIRSLRIAGQAEVTLCASPNLAGECLTLDATTGDLGPLSARISSWQVDSP